MTNTRAEVGDSIAVYLERLDSSYESIVINPDVGGHGIEYFVSVRTPSRDIAIATVDAAGTVWIYPRSLVRAADNDLIAQTRLHQVFNLLKSAKDCGFHTRSSHSRGWSHIGTYGMAKHSSP